MTLTREQSLEKAKELNIVHGKRDKTSKVIGLINDLTGGDFTEAKAEKAPSTDGLLKCIIHSGDRDNDEKELVGSINGDTFQVKLGEEVELPRKYLPAIKDAVIEHQEAILNDKNEPTGKTRTRQLKRYIVEAV